MKIFFVWLLWSHSLDHHDIVTAFVHEDDCQTTAQALNAKVGPHRGYSWECKKQGVER